MEPQEFHHREPGENYYIKTLCPPCLDFANIKWRLRRKGMTNNILIVHPRDNVAVALRPLTAGEKATAKGIEGLTALQEIPASHKIALKDIPAGEEIIKYGEVVAVCTRDIKKGQWVHTHNLESKRWRK